MIRLVPMTRAEFQTFEEHDIREFAAEEVRAGFWTEAESIEKARRAHAHLLPDGLATQDHFFYSIQESEHGAAVGVLWLMVSRDSAKPSGFIYDIEIHEPYRRQGYARAAMLELERLARQMGLRQLGLHVFAHNTSARALYESLGYSVGSLNLLKDL